MESSTPKIEKIGPKNTALGLEKEDSNQEEDEFMNTASIVNAVVHTRGHTSSQFDLGPRSEEFQKKKITLYLWKNFLTVIGNINAIHSPANHELAIKKAIEIWESLAKIRDKELKVPFGESLVPPIYEFVTWFFEACDLPEYVTHFLPPEELLFFNFSFFSASSEFVPGKVEAYQFICDFMSRKNDFGLDPESPKGTQPGTEHIHPKSMELLPYFTRLVAKGLTSKETKIVLAIILHSDKLFTTDLPGILILAPIFVETLETFVILSWSPPSSNFASKFFFPKLV